MASQCEKTAQRKRVIGKIYLTLLICFLLSTNLYTFSNPSEPTVTPSKVNVDDVVLVEGDGVGGGLTAVIYLDEVKTWDGSAGALNATSSEPSGYYSVTFKAPEIPGGTHYIIAVEEGCPVTASTSFTITPKLNLLDYIYRDHQYSLVGTGFGASTAVILMMREKTTGSGIDNWPATTVSDEYFSIGDGATRTHASTLSMTPIKPGTLSITDGTETIIDIGGGVLEGSSGGSGKIDYVTGEVHARFDSAPAQYTVITSSYDHFQGVSEISLLTSDPLTANSKGTVETEIEIESLDFGDYYVCALDSLNNTLVDEVKLCPRITLSDSEVDVGDLLTIKGRNFTPGKEITSVTLSREGWSEECQIVPSAPYADSDGDLQIDVFIPQVPEEDKEYLVEVMDSDGLVSQKALAVEDRAWIECTLDRDDESYRVHLVGRNYQNLANQKVAVEVVDQEIPTTIFKIAQVDTDDYGCIDTTFVVVSNDDRKFTVRAYSETANIESETFLQVTPLTVELSKDHGLPGDTVKINGEGFTPKKHWNATIDGETLVSTDEGIVTSTGRLRLATSYARFTVPEMEPGEYTVCFTDVETWNRVEATFTIDPWTEVVDHHSPVAVIECLDSGVEGEYFYFSGRESTDEDGVILYYTWSFGDGFSSNNMNPIHKYSTQGDYTVKLTVKDNDGLSSSTEKTIHIKDEGTQADFTAVNPEGLTPLTVQFWDASESYDDITRYEWDFGDGYKSSDRNPTHTYTETGFYDVALTIFDVDGGEFTTVKEGFVKVWHMDYEPPKIEVAQAERTDTENVHVAAYIVDDQKVATVTLSTVKGETHLQPVSGADGLYSCIAERFTEGKIVATDVAGNTQQIQVVTNISAVGTGLQTLSPGWNTVTIHENQEKTPVNALALLPLGQDAVAAYTQAYNNSDAKPFIESIWRYDPYIGYVMYDPATGLGEITHLRSGKTYWIKVSPGYPLSSLLTSDCR